MKFSHQKNKRLFKFQFDHLLVIDLVIYYDIHVYICSDLILFKKIIKFENHPLLPSRLLEQNGSGVMVIWRSRCASLWSPSSKQGARNANQKVELGTTKGLSVIPNSKLLVTYWFVEYK